MKSFSDICRMTQNELKGYLTQYLKSKKYEPVLGDGYVYAEGELPVLLVAHLDTVHKQQCTEIINIDGNMSAREGIGGDDRCGVYIIMNLINTLRCSVLFCEDEEIGCVGAKKFANSILIKELDVNYIIEFDRKGNNDAVFYSCDNPDFEEFILEHTGFKTAWGSFSDISILAPKAKIAAVNLSSGYYNAHTTSEYVNYADMVNTIEVAKRLITAECDEPFEYIERKQVSWYDSDFDIHDYYNKHYYGCQTTKTKKPSFELEMEVVYMDKNEIEQVGYITGNSKLECWATFFLEYSDVCFDDIVDYSFI